jgi:general secretion pathway protein J
MRRRAQSGVTLIEVLIAVTLLSLLSVGMLFAMRVGLNAWGTANERLMSNRRAAGAHRVFESQIAGLMPVFTFCQGAPGAPRSKSIFFQGEPQSMRFVSAFSLEEAWRGAPRILEFQVMAREGGGVRLIVNELPYTGPEAGLPVCLGMAADPVSGMRVRFAPVEAGPRSFVLADRLEYCRFSYLEPGRTPGAVEWRPDWAGRTWPLGVRVELASTDAASDLRPVSFAAPVRIRRSPEMQYEDE